MLPFTHEQFLAVFASYNEMIWPVQILAYLLGAVAVGLIFRTGSWSRRTIAAILAVMWLWTGVAYHWLSFAPINPAATVFAAFFVVQGLLFLYSGTYRDEIGFGFEGGGTAWLGLAFVAYAAVLYPLIGLWTGAIYPATPAFGVTPCPVTIFAFGMLLLTRAHVSRWLLVIPFLWSLVGGAAAFTLGVPQDWVLLFSGLVAVPVILMRDRHVGATGHPA